MARNEKLIVRHPSPKVEDDRYMLDRWTPEVTHKTRQVFRVSTQFWDGKGTAPSIVIKDKWYRVECSCGWRSAELPRPVAAQCPVQLALAERARSLKKDGERIEWKEFTQSVNDSKGNSNDEAQQPERQSER